MKKLIVLLVVFGISYGYSQENLNAYKYVIVPKKFDAFKKENQYKTSTLIKYLFIQNGFDAVYDDALPPDLERNRCLGLQVLLNDESSMFTTKTSLTLKDCASKEVFTTLMGTSKKKQYESSYREALTEAFTTIKASNYAYSPSETEEVSVPVVVTEVMEKQVEPKNKPNVAVVQQVATPENQAYKSKEPVVSNIKKTEPVEAVVMAEKEDYSGILYAQEIENGYQLVDSTPKIRLKIYRTSMPDVFSVANENGGNGMVFKKDGKWYLEYNTNGTMTTKELNIKF
ncbi:hypothetical protein HZY62_02815 [Maribacter polysiphoniae]|uniref:Uncharacterized protein n=1 Tax=Maribacter polysiphoniae TaxID=429344 RepID=A0A316E3T6_9FLAO|nr:hypothetical protein [Maribacter polysiphoniae]MBD1259506.1 hypothetical protein [Maribacter polysiphoniae]PWK25071.1 hypothetical protein LX92_01440 [Maribacter polysiphoniae]